MQELFSKRFSPALEHADNADEMGLKRKSKLVDKDKDVNPERGARIAHKREQLNETQDVFGERFGVTQVTVSRWEKGEPPQKRYWSALSQLLGVSRNFFLPKEGNQLPYDQLTSADAPQIIPAPPSSRVPLAGRVGGGQWIEVDFGEDVMGDVSAPQSDRYPGAKRIAYLVDGDSMNLGMIPDGFYVVAADFAEAGVSLQTGMIVVAEEIRDGGHLRRRTVKEVHVFRDRYELRPKSSNPAHQTIKLPIDYFDEPKEGQPDEVRVIGIVIGCWYEFNSFGPKP